MKLTALQPLHFTPLPLGAIKPSGWLKNQLQLQADGLTGHLDEFWPSIAQSRWIGGEAEGWERGPYWLDGLIPLAFLLDDDRLKAKAKFWIDYILEHQHDDGWLGEKDAAHVGVGQSHLDPWPQFVLFKALRQWYEATGDERIIPAMERAMRRIRALLQEEPLQSWARMRWADLVLSVHWVYEHTDAPFLLELAQFAHDQGYDWRDHFSHFTRTERATRDQLKDETHALEWHGVNNAMGLKSGAIWWRQSGEDAERDWITHALEVLDRYHGQVTGMFAADEHFAGRNPSQGTELCTVTELMFTLEMLLTATASSRLADRLERVAFNALPGGCTPDMRAHVYHQQINQVLCDVSTRDWVSSGQHANIYGLEPNFGCCTANLHQGWPKLTTHAWMKKGEDGLAVLSYCPVEIMTTVSDVLVLLRVDTDYPFRESVTITATADAATKPPYALNLYLRIPEWAEGATLAVNGKTNALDERITGDYFHVGVSMGVTTYLTLNFPMPVRQEPRSDGAVSLTRGPLVYALQIAERRETVKEVEGWPDYAYYPESLWNYALATEQTSAITVQEQPLGSVPFDPSQVPVLLDVPVRQIPSWGMKNNSAESPPTPEQVAQAERGDLETKTFIPFGFARLRVAELPVTTG